jgi:hypothetical protein
MQQHMMSMQQHMMSMQQHMMSTQHQMMSMQQQMMSMQQQMNKTHHSNIFDNSSRRRSSADVFASHRTVGANLRKKKKKKKKKKTTKENKTPQIRFHHEKQARHSQEGITEESKRTRKKTKTKTNKKNNKQTNKQFYALPRAVSSCAASAQASSFPSKKGLNYPDRIDGVLAPYPLQVLSRQAATHVDVLKS